MSLLHCDFKPYLLIHIHPRDLDSLAGKNRTAVVLPIDEVLQTLNDLITYFQLPDAELEHEEKQIKLRSLKNRQNLFKQEVSLFASFRAWINKATLVWWIEWLYWEAISITDKASW